MKTAVDCLKTLAQYTFSNTGKARCLRSARKIYCFGGVVAVHSHIVLLAWRNERDFWIEQRKRKNGSEMADEEQKKQPSPITRYFC